MRNITISNLQGQNFASFYGTYLHSFSDYPVPYHISEEQLKTSLEQVAYDPSLSFGAFENNDRMVGYWLSGYGKVHNEKIGYGAGTGVIPGKRRGGIATRLFATLEQEIIRRRIDRYILEVHCSNTAAIEFYRQCGFEMGCVLHSYQASDSPFSDTPISGDLRIRRASLEELAAIYESYLDYRPSWQNTMEAMRWVRNSTKAFIVKGGAMIYGYGILQPNLGRISQIGILDGRSAELAIKMLLREFYKHVEGSEPLQIRNIPDHARRTIEMLQKEGFIEFASQYEMTKSF